MTKKEQAWLDWFKECFDAATRAGKREPHKERIPWNLIEEKGIELKVVRTDEPGWFDRLQNKWISLFPARWCEEIEAAIERGEIVQKEPPRRPSPWRGFYR